MPDAAIRKSASPTGNVTAPPAALPRVRLQVDQVSDQIARSRDLAGQIERIDPRQQLSWLPDRWTARALPHERAVLTNEIGPHASKLAVRPRYENKFGWRVSLTRQFGWPGTAMGEHLRHVRSFDSVRQSKGLEISLRVRSQAREAEHVGVSAKRLTEQIDLAIDG